MTHEYEENRPRVGRGRPRKIDGDSVRLTVWIGDEQRDMLREMSAKSGFNQSDLIRRMIQVYYQMNRNQWGLE